MRLFKYFSIIIIALSLMACEEKEPQLSIKTTASNNTAKLGDAVKLSINNPDGLNIQSVEYLLDGEVISKDLKLTDVKLGRQALTANVIVDGKTYKADGNLIVLNNKKPELYTYDIVNTYPHDITSYTQGLEFYNGELYESTGQYGESKLRKLDYNTGEVLQNKLLSNAFFAEGLSVLNDNIYQLTWKENTGIIYNVNTFEKKGIFRYGESKEGWGLCNDGTNLYKSDGTEQIWTLTTDDFTEASKIEAYTHTGKIKSLNELEWINGKIYANIYQENGVVVINPKNGAVEKVIDFSPLKELVTQHPELDVLNGIAYNPTTETIFVTGKNWDKLFEVTIRKK
ncbi:glutaminyl-peptide cyclotransferase [Winogradskyella maritima]|uniref:Glutaminyl-peptide cyclotransferase n=1 Tax=Winogradskyella maritima TaxID=1517766 RepID=A0ABV8AI36_9FLAO|nr:glutaminyl-peptide cyclotransferase [Winogradskyella maritima]